MSLCGVDVSHWQGEIDFSSWINSCEHNDFMIMKATESDHYVDKMFYRNAGQCVEHNVLSGSYHYVVGTVSALNQARHYISEHKKVFGDYPATMALDVEDHTLLSRHWEEVRGIVEVMAQEIIDSCKTRPFIYLSKGFMRSDMFKDLGRDCPGWIAHWNTKHPPHRRDLNTSIWQTSASGIVTGIRGRVDTDIFFGTAQAWREIAKPCDLNDDVAVR